MRAIARLSLQTKVLLIQIGIVVLVAGLISVAVISALMRLVEQQSGERVLGIAYAVAAMPTIRAALDTPAAAATIQPLAESVRQSAGLSFVVVANRDLIRFSHPNPELIGRSLQDPPLPDGAIAEDDARALGGQ